MQRTCARCGRTPAAGNARIGDDWYCHGDEVGPTCYETELWNWHQPAAQPPRSFGFGEWDLTSPERDFFDRELEKSRARRRNPNPNTGKQRQP